MKRYTLILSFLLLMALVTGCFQKDLSDAREAYAQTATGNVVIAFPGPVSYMKDMTGFYDGVMLAVNEINTDGGIDGRMIEPRFLDDKGTFNDGIKLAQEIALDEEILAVIGHWNTYITLPAARIYDEAGVLMLSPVVSNPQITKKEYATVFQNTINDNEMGWRMADYVRKQGYERVVVFYADNDYGRGLSWAFEDYLSDAGGMVVDRITEFVSVQEFNQAYEKWQAFDYDAVFVADSMPHAGAFIQQIRQKDPNIPIFAGDGLDMADLPAMLGDAAEGIVIATMYNSEGGDKRQEAFSEAYKEQYDMDPDVWAAQGYDSVQLLTYAMKKAQRVTPSEIAEVLLSDTGFKGVLGSAAFTMQGEMTGRNIYHKIVRNGRMSYLKK